jgi:hypothetical protein
MGDNLKALLAPNRVAVYLTALASLATALAPVLADLDSWQTLGLIGSLSVFGGVVLKWLHGWQKHEARAVAFASPAIDIALDMADVLDKLLASSYVDGDVIRLRRALIAQIAKTLGIPEGGIG